MSPLINGLKEPGPSLSSFKAVLRRFINKTNDRGSWGRALGDDRLLYKGPSRGSRARVAMSQGELLTHRLP